MQQLINIQNQIASMQLWTEFRDSFPGCRHVSVGLKKAPHSAPFCSLSLPGEGKENAAHLHNLQIGFAQNMTPLLLLHSLSCSYSWAVQIKRQTPSQPATGIETHANGMQCSRRRRPGGGKERSTRD